MLLRGIHFHLNRTFIVLSEEILYGIHIVLTHIATSTSIIIPIPTECLVHSMRVVRLLRSRPQPHIVVKLCRHRHWIKMLLTYPVKLPVKSCMLGDCNFQRPTEQATLHQFFEREYGSAETIKIISKTEPRIEAENSVVALHSLHYSFPFTDSTGHRLFTPYIFSCLGCRNAHKSMPVRRSCNMHNIDVRVVDKIHPVGIEINV